MVKQDGQNRIRRTLKILLPILCIAWLAFILINSMQTGGSSSAQSATVVDKVQDTAQVVAPESWVATATGEDYDVLHNLIRKIAHFVQFAVLGALFCWCYFAYTFKPTYLFLPILGVLFFPVIDEFIQSFVAGRGSKLTDILIDTVGGLAGVLFAVLSVAIGVLVYKIKTREKADENGLKPPKDHPMYRTK